MVNESHFNLATFRISERLAHNKYNEGNSKRRAIESIESLLNRLCSPVSITCTCNIVKHSFLKYIPAEFLDGRRSFYAYDKANEYIVSWHDKAL